jgi:hypothetical protein
VGTAEEIDDLLGDLIPVLGLMVAIATALIAMVVLALVWAAQALIR